MKILLVEDEQDLLTLMVKYLQREGFACDTATTWREAHRRLVDFEYDCVVVDLNLPGGDGLDLVRLLRDEEEQPGVVIISVRDQVEDRILGLELGADDYLAKPFHLTELNARIKAVLRRKTNEFSDELDLGRLKVQLGKRAVYIDGQELQLTRKEYEILLYMLRNKNRVVSKDSLAEYLWGDYLDQSDSFNFLYAHMKNLRRKLAAQGGGHWLKTVYGIGYKFSIN